MKNKILLNENDTFFLFTHFLKNGKDFPLPDSYSHWSKEKKQKLVYRMCGGDTYRTAEKNQKLFQMLLLYDEIIFPYGILDNVDIHLIKKYFKVTVLDDMAFINEYKLNYLLENETTKEEDELFVNYMKPAILNFLVEEIGNKYYIKKSIYSTKEFINYMIDCAFGKEMTFCDKFYKNIKENAELYTSKVYNPFYFDCPRNIIEKVDAYLGELYQSIYRTFYRVLWEVQLSNDNDCMLYNSYYDIQYLGLNQMNYISKPEEDIYNNIRINISDKIRQLPQMTTFEELLRIKDKHKKDIKRMRQVITELERCVVSGEVYIAQKVILDLEQSIKELNKSESLSKVSTIATYAAVPIGIAETMLNIFPVVGITIGIIGAATTVASKHFLNQNNWINIVR